MKIKKHVSFGSLISLLSKHFEAMPDWREPKRRQISYALSRSVIIAIPNAHARGSAGKALNASKKWVIFMKIN